MTKSTRREQPRLLHRLPLIVLIGIAVLGLAGGAFAFFTSTGSGTGAATVGTLNSPRNVTAISPTYTSTVNVSWSAPIGGVTPQGYYVTSYNTSTRVTSPACGTNALSLTLSSPCADTAVPDGTYNYTVVAVYNSWSANATSSPVSVSADTTPPTDSVALVAPLGAYLNTSTETIYFNTNTGGSFGLSDAVYDTQSGPASATFPGIAAAGWSGHTGSDVQTIGTGSKPTITYISGHVYQFSTSAVATSGTVTSRDVVGNTSSGVALTLTPDDAGPTGGALSANSTSATSAGTSSFSTTSSYSLSRTDFTSDAGSGVASSVLTVRYAPWTSNACGTYGSATTITGAPPQTSPSGNGCYQYTLTGMDNVGNTSTLTTTVKVDTTAPVTTDNTLSIGNGWKNTAQTVTLSPTDAGSGVAQTYYTTDGTTPAEIGGVPQGTTQTGTSISLNSSGQYTIKYFSVDLAGNVETVKTAGTVIRIDLIAPTVPAPIVNGNS